MLGALFATLLLVIVFAANLSFLIEFTISSGAVVARFLSWALPERFLYWAVPDGGGPAAVLLIAVSAWLQLSVAIGAATYFFLGISRQSR